MAARRNQIETVAGRLATIRAVAVAMDAGQMGTQAEVAETAERLGMSARQAHRYKHDLIELGWPEVEAVEVLRRVAGPSVA